MNTNRFGPMVIWTITCLTFLFLGSTAFPTPLALHLDVPDNTLQGPGLSLVQEGVGLQHLTSVTTGGGSIPLTITINGDVNKAFLYWAGRVYPCPTVNGVAHSCLINSEPYLDQVLKFGASGEPLTTITGTVIGEEKQLYSSSVHNIGYLYDATSIVAAKGPGTHTFEIQDGDTGSNFFRLNGATLLVMYTDHTESEFFRVQVFDGLDFAYGRADQNPPDAQVTVPVEFTYDSTDTDRTAQLLISVGDTTPSRPDRIDIIEGGTFDSTGTASLVNELTGLHNGNNMASWDALTEDITIPAGATKTTVQLFSEPFGGSANSLLWEVAALRIPVENPACDGRIADFVWRDLNGDGIQGPDEPGEAGILVMLKDSVGNTVSIAQTDSNGFYEFTTASAITCPGTFTVEIELPGGLSLTDPDQGDGTNDSRPNGVMVELTFANPEDTTIDFGLVGCTPCQKRSGSGKATSLTLQYVGLSTAEIEVVQKKPESPVFSGTVAPNGEFTFSGNDDMGTLSTEISIFVDGVLSINIHTSCSKDLGPGLQFGDFLVVSGTTENGGQMCPLDANEYVGVVVGGAAEFTCTKPIDALTMIWDGTPDPIRVKAFGGKKGDVELLDLDNISIGTAVEVSGYAWVKSKKSKKSMKSKKSKKSKKAKKSKNDVFWIIYEAGTDTEIGQSVFHLSCSDQEMNGPEDCGKRLGDGKKNASGFMNDWLLEGMVDKDAAFTCSDDPPTP